jgi:hypothetical protein
VKVESGFCKYCTDYSSDKAGKVIEHEMRIHGANKGVLELHELSRKLFNKR